MKMKKLASLGLASALALSVAAPAFAADTDQKQDSEVTGDSTYMPTISVNVAATNKVILNPYGIKYDSLTNGGLMGSGYETGDQIINVPSKITNNSDVPVAVNASVKATLGTGSKVVFATADWGKNTPDSKSVLAWLEVQKQDTDGLPNWATSYNAKTAGQLLLSTTAASKTSMATLASKDKSGSIGEFKITGKAVQSPTDAWTADDKFDTAITWTFVPQPSDYVAPDVDLDGNYGTNGFTFTPKTTGHTASVDYAVDTTAHKITVTLTYGATYAPEAGDKIAFKILPAAGGALVKDNTPNKTWDKVNDSDKKDSIAVTMVASGSGTLAWKDSTNLAGTDGNQFTAWDINGTPSVYTVEVKTATT